MRVPGDRTILILYPGCISFETALAAELLHEHYPVVVATPDGRAHLASNGTRISADRRFDEVDPDASRVVVVPGGDCEAVLEDEPLCALLRGAHQAGALIGAICAGPLLVARAGLLRGRRFTHGFKNWHTDFLAPFWEGSTFVDALVVRDGNIVTAMAEGHVDFAIELLAALELGDEAGRERRRGFYKGIVQAHAEPVHPSAAT